MPGVFDISGASLYDDKITERYHFPTKYLAIANELVGDWIVYRETRVQGGRMAYVSAAFVDRIDKDPLDPTRYYARVSKYFEFDTPVPYRGPEGQFLERFLRDLPQAGDVGRALRGTSVRTLEQDDFSAIVDQGLYHTLDPRNPYLIDTLGEAHASGQLFQPERRSEAILVNRLVRLASFRLHVLNAYGGICAVTGLGIMDRAGRPEAQAAHILPVADGGPDTVRNGIALCSTLHWLFDRHLFTIDESYRVVARATNLPEQLMNLLRPGSSIRLPEQQKNYPSQEYLSAHRSKYRA